MTVVVYQRCAVLYVHTDADTCAVLCICVHVCMCMWMRWRPDAGLCSAVHVFLTALGRARGLITELLPRLTLVLGRYQHLVSGTEVLC